MPRARPHPRRIERALHVEQQPALAEHPGELLDRQVQVRLVAHGEHQRVESGAARRARRAGCRTRGAPRARSPWDRARARRCRTAAARGECRGQTRVRRGLPFDTPSPNTSASAAAETARSSHCVRVPMSAQAAILARPLSLRGNFEPRTMPVSAVRRPWVFALVVVLPCQIAEILVLGGGHESLQRSVERPFRHDSAADRSTPWTAARRRGVRWP